jgi:chromosome segregation ATPase
MSNDYASPAATQIDNDPQTIRVNAMIKTLIGQRDTANNQIVKLSSDLAVLEARNSDMEKQARAVRDNVEILITNNQTLSARITVLEDANKTLSGILFQYEQKFDVKAIGTSVVADADVEIEIEAVTQQSPSSFE